MEEWSSFSDDSTPVILGNHWADGMLEFMEKEGMLGVRLGGKK